MIRLQVFGGLRMWRSGAELDLGPARQRLVLAALLAGRGDVVGLGRLIEVVWGDRPPDSAANQLHRLIGQVRRLFEPDLPMRSAGSRVHPAPDGYRLTVEPGECDLTAFYQLVGRSSYAEALEIAREPLFAGLPAGVLEHPMFVALARDRIDAALAAFPTTGAGFPAAGADRVLAALERIAASEPLDEPLQAALIRALSAAGRRPEALIHFDRVRRQLADELGAGPGPELRAAHLDALTQPDVPDDHRPAQLPPRISGFTTRADTAPVLDRQLCEAAAGQHLVITVLTGMAGIGKTALAVDWAHRAATHFPDGQLFVNLRGFDPGGHRVSPLEALNGLLESVGVGLAALGDSDLAARAARFRQAVAGRRMVILLDDARDSAHVRPLLPGTAGCLVIVTSRNQLTGLISHEGAQAVALRRFSDEEAHQFLSTRLGAARVDAEPAAAEGIIEACAGLPLALAIVAARAAVTPGLALADVVTELRASGRRLDALTTGEAGDNIRSAFTWSYRSLTPGAARMFRLLAAHPGPEISLTAMAGVAGIGPDPAGRQLRELAAASMITEAGDDRFAVPDLLRDYAGELLALAPDGEQPEAERRLVDHYVRSMRLAYERLGRTPLTALDPDLADVAPDDMADEAAALSWYIRERAVLVAVIGLALDRGWLRSAVTMVVDWRPLRFSSAEPTTDVLPLIHRALAAAEELGDPVLHAEMLRDTADQYKMSDPARADNYVEQALVIYQRIGDLIGQAMSLRNLASFDGPSDPAGKRLGYARRAIEVARHADRPEILTLCLLTLGEELEDVGKWRESTEANEEALETARAGGVSYLETFAVWRLAEGLMHIGEYARAAEMAEWALSLLTDATVTEAVLINGMLAKAAYESGNKERARSASAAFHELLERHGYETFAELWGAENVDGHIAQIAAVDAALANL